MEESADVSYLPPVLDPYAIPGNMADQLVSPGPYVDGDIADYVSNGMSLGYGGLDWLDIQLEDHLPPTNTAINTTHSKELIMTPPTDVCDTSGQLSHLLSSPSWHNTTQSQNGLMNPAFQGSSSIQPTVQQWPFDGTREQVHPRYRLSPLRDVL